MTNKSNSTTKKQILINEQNKEPSQSNDQFLLIDQKMLRLRQKRQRLQVNQSLIFRREIQKMMGEEFSPELALAVFDKTWSHASNNQKKEWHTHKPSFRHFFKPHRQKSGTHNSVTKTAGISEVHSDELS